MLVVPEPAANFETEIINLDIEFCTHAFFHPGVIVVCTSIHFPWQRFLSFASHNESLASHLEDINAFHFQSHCLYWLCFIEALIEQGQLTTSTNLFKLCQKQFSKGLALSKTLQYIQPVYKTKLSTCLEELGCNYKNRHASWL